MVPRGRLRPVVRDGARHGLACGAFDSKPGNCGLTGSRLPSGGRIDRTRPVSFTWEGRNLSGFAGDSLAAALLANGVRVVGRSFKYHRPRGIFGAWAEEPNAILD